MSATTNRGFAKVSTTSPDYEGASGGPWKAIGDAVDAIDAALGIERRTTDTSAPIVSKEGTVVLAKVTAGAWTLAAPTAGLPAAGGDDGKILRIAAATAQAHTVTQTTPGFNSGGSSKDVATWAAAIGNNLELLADNGVWIVLENTGVTLG